MFNRRIVSALSILVAISIPFLVKINTKNTCKSYFDYFLINFGGDCYYNPDVDLNVAEIIEKYTGIIGGKYTVSTEDGYILTMFRIARTNPIGVVLLQPPVTTGAIAWLSDGSESLAFTLWKKGYDVWLSNHRGVPYSRKHVNLTEEDVLFWDFSFHEIALYDLDAEFKLIRKETNYSKIIFIGYSLSSTLGLVYASLNPEKSKDFLESYILVAPVTIMKHFSCPIKVLFYIMYPFEYILRSGEFLTAELVRYGGQFLNLIPTAVNIVISTVMGWTSGIDPVLYPYILPHHGRGIPNKMIYHFSQIYFNGTNFSLYDYGKETNQILYNSDEPPAYPLENVVTPVHIIYGDSDALATPLDIKILCDKLPKEQIHGIYEIENHNHIDYFFGPYRQAGMNDIIYKILEKL